MLSDFVVVFVKNREGSKREDFGIVDLLKCRGKSECNRVRYDGLISAFKVTWIGKPAIEEPHREYFDYKCSSSNFKKKRKCSEKEYQLLLYRFPMALSHIVNQNEEAYREVVFRTPAAFTFVKEQPPNLCEEFIRHNFWNIRYVRTPTQEMCEYAVSLDGSIIEHLLHHQHLNMMSIWKAALKNRPWVVEFAPEHLRKDLEKTAVEACPSFIRNIQEQTEELCLIAVKHGGHALEYIGNQTEEICRQAIRQNPSSVTFIKIPITLTPEDFIELNRVVEEDISTYPDGYSSETDSN